VRWPFLLALALAFGLALPGFSDWMSRQRDAELDERISTAVDGSRAPLTWSFTFDTVTYACTVDLPFVPSSPAYRCVAAPVRPGG
jgi:hypothetical protein